MLPFRHDYCRHHHQQQQHSNHCCCCWCCCCYYYIVLVLLVAYLCMFIHTNVNLSSFLLVMEGWLLGGFFVCLFVCFVFAFSVFSYVLLLLGDGGGGHVWERVFLYMWRSCFVAILRLFVLLDVARF